MENKIVDPNATVHLSTRETELIRAVVTTTMEEAGHMCHFDEATRKRVHSFSEVMEQEGANHGTLIVLAQFGKSIQNITKKAITYFIISIIVLILAAFFGAVIVK